MLSFIANIKLFENKNILLPTAKEVTLIFTHKLCQWLRIRVPITLSQNIFYDHTRLSSTRPAINSSARNTKSGFVGFFRKIQVRHNSRIARETVIGGIFLLLVFVRNAFAIDNQLWWDR